jgi:hypothetical protein
VYDAGAVALPDELVAVVLLFRFCRHERVMHWLSRPEVYDPCDQSQKLMELVTLTEISHSARPAELSLLFALADIRTVTMRQSRFL